MEKCQYFNNHKSAVTLMLDDFSLTATTINGQIEPSNDWGAGLGGEHSLYRYLTANLLAKYPEIKGSIFYPLHQHGVQSKSAGYHVVFSHDYNKLADFIQQVSPRFEFAFHGLAHERYINPQNQDIKGNCQHEFEYLALQDAETIKQDITAMEHVLGTRFVGGKYPGYIASSDGPQIIEVLGFKWWMSSAHMMNQKHKDNRHGYLGNSKSIVNLPTNISGDCFKPNVDLDGANLLRLLKNKLDTFNLERHIHLLYEKQLIISIQEHYMGLRTDGKRQRPNVFDDISSLDKLFGLLRGLDLWFATCTQIAHYVESYDNTQLVQLGDGNYSITYQGTWETMFLTVCTSSKSLRNISTGQLLKGIYRNGVWVFNNVAEGIYQEL